MRRLPLAVLLPVVAFLGACGGGDEGGGTPRDEAGVPADAGLTGADAGPVSDAAFAGDSAPSGTVWGTFKRPFAADSLWNSYPENPALGSYALPPTGTNYFPSIGPGAFSSQMFLAAPSDPPKTVFGPNGGNITVQDEQRGLKSITIPHWPSATVGATGSDGHADVIDEVAGIVHSFYQLKKAADGTFTASLYAWSPLRGSGWGDPAHYYQGARAAGVSTTGGMIRTHEIDDGDSQYRHALAMTLDGSALKAGYIFPATAEDSNAPTNYKGGIPMGSLLLLPASFDASAIKNPKLRKIVETLKTYGARVIDQNYGTPFAIFVENGSGFSLMPNGWDNAVAADLTKIAAALRPLANENAYIDGEGRRFVPNRNLNLLSTRGPWQLASGPALGLFESWKQAVTFPAGGAKVIQFNSATTAISKTTWAPWKAGQNYTFTVHATGGGLARLELKKAGYVTAYTTNDLGDGQSVTFPVSADATYLVPTITSGVGAPSEVSYELHVAP